jgi:gas vesicle protein
MKKFFLGLLAGISAGILFAPQSGKKLRERLKNSNMRMNDFSDALFETAKNAGTEARNFIESPEAKEILTSGKKNINDFLSFLEEKGKLLSKRGQKEVECIVSSVVDMVEKHTSKKKGEEKTEKRGLLRRRTKSSTSSKK